MLEGRIRKAFWDGLNNLLVVFFISYHSILHKNETTMIRKVPKSQTHIIKKARYFKTQTETECAKTTKTSKSRVI